MVDEPDIDDSPVYKRYCELLESVPNTGAYNISGNDHKLTTLDYAEEVFMGNRYYDSAGIVPKFEFGFGLSYSNFKILNVITDKKIYRKDETISIKYKIENTSEIKGKEVVQLYIRNHSPATKRTFKELKDYQKHEIAPGEKIGGTFHLKVNDLAYFDFGKWQIDSSEYELIVNGYSCIVEIV